MSAHILIMGEDRDAGKPCFAFPPENRKRGVIMATIKVSGTNLTKHFTFAEYAKN